MSDCCSKSNSTDSFPRKHVCPANGKEYGSVSSETIKHHVKAPWMWQSKKQGYYFCSDPDCPVVYFGQDNSVIVSDSLRTVVGIKSKSNDTLVCYCYGITKTDANNDPLARQFVIEEKRAGAVHVRLETRQESAAWQIFQKVSAANLALTCHCFLIGFGRNPASKGDV